MIPGLSAVMTAANTTLPLTNFVFTDSATSTGTGVTIPTVVAGDVLIAISSLYAAGGGTPNEMMPGYDNTNLSATAEKYGLIVGTRICDGSETGDTVFSANLTTQAKMVLHFTPTGTVTDVTVGDARIYPTSGNPAPQTTPAGSATHPCIVFAILVDFDSTAAPSFSSASPAFDGYVSIGSGGHGMKVGYKIYMSSPHDHTVDSNDLGAQTWLFAGYLELN